MRDRCALCPRINACIPPDGPKERGGLLFIGEAPGFKEDQNAKKNPPGVPFIGPTGEETNRHYLPLAGLRREGVDFTNAIRCLPITAGGKLDPNRGADLALLSSCCEAFLYRHIESSHPRLLIPLGQFACRAVFGEAFDLELKHGIPTETPWGIPAFPMYHPALGLHEPKKMLYVRGDWGRLAKYLRGTLHIPCDPYAGQEDYAEVTDPRELGAMDPIRPLAADTESGREGPFCLTYSQLPGQGRLIRSSRVDLLEAFQARLDVWESQILFHNWLYDWPITETMGLQFPAHRVVDTMARIYHLGNLPQGLKALSYRELGMEMEDFEDVVKPYSTQKVLEYYWAAYAETWEKPEPQTVRDPKTGKWKLYKPQSMNTKLKRFFTDFSKNTEKDVFGMWTDNWEVEHAPIEEKLGPWPGMDIRHVPFPKALFYACRDSDALIRFWYDVLTRAPAMVRHFSQEHWIDKSRRIA